MTTTKELIEVLNTAIRVIEPRGIEKARLINPLKGAPSLRPEDLGVPAYLNGNFAKAVAILRSLSEAGVWAMSVLESRQIAQFLEFCVRAATKPEILSKTVVSIGFGGSLSAPSLRLPAYIVSGLRFLDNLRRSGLPQPTLRIFTGQQAAVSVNGFDEDKLWERTFVNFALLRAYALRFYPEVASQLVFDYDHPIEGAIKAHGKRFASELSRLARGRQGASDIIPALADRGRTHGEKNGEEESLFYAALHPLLFGEAEVPASAWLAAAAPEALISFGGWPERLFNVARLLYASKSDRPSFMFISDAGKLPVYYPKDGEPQFSSAAAAEFAAAPHTWQSLAKDPELAADFQLLASTTEEAYAYASWAKETADLFDLATVVDDFAAPQLLANAILASSASDHASLQEEAFAALDEIQMFSEEERLSALAASKQRAFGFA